MRKSAFFLVLWLYCVSLAGQKSAFDEFISDSSMRHASVSIYMADAKSGLPVIEYESEKSLTPASVMKLVTTAAALELLGPDHTFTTMLGYAGSLNIKTGRFTGDIIIKGGGDPVLGSENFADHYNGFLDGWVLAIKQKGIKKVEGRVITDDSYFDYQPVPAKWIWEDVGNYYGAGAYGLSVFDNTYKIHFRTGSEKTDLELTGINPPECANDFTDRLIAEGTTDRGYVFSSPYNKYSWYEGSIPVNKNDFVLKASVTDPPLLLAEILTEKLTSAGISITGKPSTTRLINEYTPSGQVFISRIDSPSLEDIIEVLNHESVNLYAEHLVKELGKHFSNDGSAAAGRVILYNFLKSAGIDTTGFFIEDGSGLSTLDAITTKGLTELLIYMKNKSRYASVFINSLPAAGKEGTLKNYFHDPLFSSRMVAKSGSMTRVRSYSGYLKALSGKEMAFSIIVNNYSTTPKYVVSGIEKILKDAILHN
jgi:D-alanyl-D-alanine carboxypeptidase/D-alanyl-D-alanine-endopeptidase (penicillin-binding protein 4)